jgi:membrane associated rhomboid family serine protease
VFALIPYRVDVLFPRVPWANWLLIALCAVVFGLDVSGHIPDIIYESMVLENWHPAGLFGHMFLHLDIFHLLGNMLFLWLFGNAVCARIGNGTYLATYLVSGLLAAAIHLLMDGEPAMGASGAVNGIVGLYLAIYPRNDICCAYIFVVKPGTFEISGFWLILLWFLMDIFGALSGGGDIAYWAHVGGFLAGLGSGFLLLYLRRVTFNVADLPHLLQLVFPSRFQDIPAFERAGLNVAEKIPEPEPEFFLYSGDQQLGPYPLKVVRQLMGSGQVAQTDFIYDDTTQAGRPLNEFMMYK